MSSGADPRQGDVWIVNLDPTVGDEIRERRPALITSRDELNAGEQTGTTVDRSILEDVSLRARLLVSVPQR